MKLRLKATVQRKANDDDEVADAVGVWMDNNPIVGMPEGAVLDSWFVTDFEWTTMDTDGAGTNGHASGQMAVMLPDGSGLDGQFQADFIEAGCVRVTFSAPVYED